MINPFCLCTRLAYTGLHSTEPRYIHELTIFRRGICHQVGLALPGRIWLPVPFCAAGPVRPEEVEPWQDSLPPSRAIGSKLCPSRLPRGKKMEMENMQNYWCRLETVKLNWNGIQTSHQGVCKAPGLHSV